MKGRQSQPLDAFLLTPRIQPGSGPCAQRACSWGPLRSFGAQPPQEFSHEGLDKSCTSLWPSEAETGAAGVRRRRFRGGARAAVGRAPVGWRLAQLHHLRHPHSLCRFRRLLLPAGIGPSHTSFCLAPSLCVPVSPRLPVSASGSRKMTLKASNGEGGSSMRTALSDLYLEHLLQKRSRPEVSGLRGSPGCGVRSQNSAAPPTSGPPPSRALSPGACPWESCPRGEGRRGQQLVRGLGCGGWLPSATLLGGNQERPRPGQSAY